MRALISAAFLLATFPLSASAARGPRAKSTTPTVLFDLGHRQLFTPLKKGELQLGQLAKRFKKRGITLKMHSQALDDAALRAATAVVISGPFAPLHKSEILALERFIKRGGRLAVLLHIGPPTHSLLTRLGVSVSNGVIRDAKHALANSPLDFRAARLHSHPVVSGLKTFSLYGVWALLPRAKFTRALAETSPTSWVDLNRDKRFGRGDAKQAFSVAVSGKLGKGAFVIFGDDAIFQNRFLKGDNLKLADNLVRWLAKRQATGEK